MTGVAFTLCPFTSTHHPTISMALVGKHTLVQISRNTSLGNVGVHFGVSFNDTSQSPVNTLKCLWLALLPCNYQCHL